MYYAQPFYRNAPVYPSYTRRNERKEIKVFGEGSISVQPDMADITLGVNTEDLVLKNAQTENRRIISQIIQALKEIGITEEHIQTSEYSIYPIYDFENGKQVFRGYKVNHMLTITVSDIDSAGLVVDTAVNNGATNVSNIAFSFSDSSSIYQKALTNAVENAIRKATSIAHTLQVKLIETPLQISEKLSQAQQPIPFGESQMVKSAATTPIEPGKQEIEAVVEATFLYYT